MLSYHKQYTSINEWKELIRIIVSGVGVHHQI